MFHKDSFLCVLKGKQKIPVHKREKNDENIYYMV